MGWKLPRTSILILTRVKKREKLRRKREMTEETIVTGPQGLKIQLLADEGGPELPKINLVLEFFK